MIDPGTASRYVARQIAVVVFEDKFHLYEAYGTRRDYLGTFTGPELTHWLATDFARLREPEPQPFTEIDLVL